MEAETPLAATAPIRPRIARIEAVVNEASGGVGASAAAELQSIAASFGIALRLASVGPDGIESAVRAAVAAAPDLVVTLAGDGTARLAAALCGPDGPLLAPLPGGTMNMLPTALYGKADWRDALESALRAGTARRVPGGEIAGQPFYVAAILGAPALWQPAREAVRRGRLRLALARARRAFSRAFSGRLRFELDGGPSAKAEALALMSPLISDACADESALEAIALDPRHGADAARLGARALVGAWRSDPAVRTQLCRRGRAFARRPIPCILDGEMRYLDRLAEINFNACAFRALAHQPKSVTGLDEAGPAAF